MKPVLKLYWSSGLKNGRRNFGDWLSPALCEALSGRKVVYAPVGRCDLVAIGSILARVKSNFWNRAVDIWGTGLIQDIEPFRSKHRIHALRGRLTAERIVNRTPSALGDPGLLCDRLLPAGAAAAGKQYAVGLIPHYADRSHPLVESFLSRCPGAHRIDIFSETSDFLRQVAACETVLSSSLHGLAVADALGVPNRWIRLSDRVRGRDFKFRDYYSVFGPAEPVPFELTGSTTRDEVLRIAESYERPGLARIKEELFQAFPYKP